MLQDYQPHRLCSERHSLSHSLSLIAGRHYVDLHNLSVEQLQDQLNQIEQSKMDLEKILSERWHEAKSDLAREIRQLIEERGYDVEEITGLVLPKKRRNMKKGNRNYIRYVDPENPENVYIRGVLPRWMKDKMMEQGYDPTQKQDREAFKANYMQAVQD
jgi:DNA-binding protein H-NS